MKLHLPKIRLRLPTFRAVHALETDVPPSNIHRCGTLLQYWDGIAVDGMCRAEGLLFRNADEAQSVGASPNEIYHAGQGWSAYWH